MSEGHLGPPPVRAPGTDPANPLEPGTMLSPTEPPARAALAPKRPCSDLHLPLRNLERTLPKLHVSAARAAAASPRAPSP